MSLMLLGILNSQAAGGGGVPAFELLATQISNGSTSSITFAGLNAYTDYKHLQIRYTVKNTGGATDLGIRFNGQTDGNYHSHGIRGTGSSVQARSQTFTSYVNFEYAMASSNGTDIFSSGILDFLDFANASTKPMLRAAYGYVNPAVFTDIYIASGMYAGSNQAVSSITLLTPFNYFASNSRFSLYGIKG